MSELNLELIETRKKIEKKIKDSRYEYDMACYELDKLQNECKHENAIISDGGQGGGIYYCNCSCPECGRTGIRYIPQYHMKKHNAWQRQWGYKNLISLKDAIKIGIDIKNNFLERYKWWGEPWGE